jgi:hypothetical protein
MNSSPKRGFILQWSLQTLLLLTAAVAVWLTYARFRQRIPQLEQQIDAMQRMARELTVVDESQIAVVKLQELWYDENRWQIYLPPGEYRIRLATREIDGKGLPPVFDGSPISAGQHLIELVQSGESDDRKITVVVDDTPLIETVESADWSDRPGSSGGSLFGRCTQRDPNEPLVLFRRRFHQRMKNGQRSTPKGPTEGLMLWIERMTSGRVGQNSTGLEE